MRRHRLPRSLPPQVAALPGRLRNAVRLSPPLGLMLLTLAVLLMALGTARASEGGGAAATGAPARPDGPKWRFDQALSELARASYGDFSDFVAPGYVLEVEQGDGTAQESWSTSSRRAFVGLPSETDFEQAIAPILTVLASTRTGPAVAAPLACDDSGACIETIGSDTVHARFVMKGGQPKLVSLRLDLDEEDEGD